MDFNLLQSYKGVRMIEFVKKVNRHCNLEVEEAPNKLFTLQRINREEQRKK